MGIVVLCNLYSNWQGVLVISRDRVRKLKDRVKNYLDLDDKGLLAWWGEPNPSFDGKKPSEMCMNAKDFNKMWHIVCFSTSPLVPKNKPKKPRSRHDPDWGF
jgi:hypothetical protein